MPHVHQAILNAFTDEMVASINVFGTIVVLRVACKTFGTLVINMQWNRRLWSEMELRQ